MKKLLNSLAAALMLFAAVPTLAQDKSVPAEGMTIQLLNSDGRVVETTKTDDKGDWSFTVSPGTYSINIPQRSIEVCAMAINEKGLPGEKKPVKGTKVAKPASGRMSSGETGESDGSSPSPEVTFSLNYTKITWDHATREAGSGMASGKRQHKPVTFVKEWNASTPQLFQAMEQGTKLEGTVKASWNLKENVK